MTGRRCALVRTVMLATSLLVAGCEAIDRPVVFEQEPIALPAVFENQAVATGSGSDPFIRQAYGVSGNVSTFDYGDVVRGFLIPFDDVTVARVAHERAVESLIGDFPFRDVEANRTIRNYLGRYLVDTSGDPFVVFLMRDHAVAFGLESNGQSEEQALARCVTFANMLFSENGMLGTFPPEAFDFVTLGDLPAAFKLEDISPTPFETLSPGNTGTVQLRFRYDYLDADSTVVSIRSWSLVIPELHDEATEIDRGNALRREAAPMVLDASRGTVDVSVPFDLTNARSGEVLRVGIALSASYIGGGGNRFFHRTVQYLLNQ